MGEEVLVSNKIMIFLKRKMRNILPFLLLVLVNFYSSANNLFHESPLQDNHGLLAENIVVLDDTYLKQNMISKEYTTYLIKHDIVLAEDITLPKECVLEFNGGFFRGKHLITGSNTIIKADLVNIISPEVTIKGSWNVTEVYPEWFGAKGDGVFDDAIAINKCLSLNSEDNSPIKIIFAKPQYYVGEIINFSGKQNVSFEGTNKNIIQKLKGNHQNMFDGGMCKNVLIKNLTFDGSLESWNFEIPVNPNWSQKNYNACIIGASNTTDITLDNCVIKNFYYGVFLGGAYEQNRLVDGQKNSDHITITNCMFEHNKMSCIDTYNRYGLYINNNYFLDNGNIAIHIEPTIINTLSGPYETSDIFTSQYPVDGVNISNNVFVWTDNPGIGIKLYRGVYAANITNNHFINGSAAIHSDGTKMFIIANNNIKNGVGIRLYGNIGSGSIYSNILVNVTSGVSCYNDASTMGGVDIHDNIIILKDDLSSLPDYFRVQNSKYHDNIIRGYFNSDTWEIKGVLNISGASNSEIYNNKLLKCNDTTIPFFLVPITNQKELTAFINKGVRIYNNIYEQKLEYEFSTDVAQTRPINPHVGQVFYDLNIKKQIIYIGQNNWVDSFGNIIE